MCARAEGNIAHAPAVLMFSSAAVMAANVGIFLFSVRTPISADAGARSDRQPYLLMVVGVTAFSTVIRGVHGSSNIRDRTSPPEALLGAVVAAAVVVMIGLSFVKIPHPGWLNVLAAAASFSAMGAWPTEQLRRTSRTPGPEHWVTLPWILRRR